jgi:hypothetical protein
MKAVCIEVILGLVKDEDFIWIPGLVNAATLIDEVDASVDSTCIISSVPRERGRPHILYRVNLRETSLMEGESDKCLP